MGDETDDRGDASAQSNNAPAPKTTIDQPRTPSPSTVVDVAAGANGDNGASTWSRVNLPPGLADQFTVVQEIPGGAEADVLLCVGRESGEHRVVKLYRSRVAELDDALLRSVQGPESLPHVVPSENWGSDHGVWFEVQEYIAGGSLADLIEDTPPSSAADVADHVLHELVEALDHVHGLDIVHRDLKPQNILIRQRDPLDLVLADFGLATLLQRSRTMRSGSRTPAYGAPEAAWGDVSRGRDWWSVGIILLELLTGEHPFRRPDGTWMEDAEIGNHLSTRAIDTSAIDDDRWQLLVRGLLVRDPADRWGSEQVHAWLDGQTPDVASEGARPTIPGVAAAAAPFAFEGAAYRDPHDLAEAFAEHWRPALRLLASGSTNDAAEALESWLKDMGQDRAASIAREAGKPERKLVRLLVAMAPELPPTFAGRRLDVDGALQLAAQASTGDSEAVKVLAAVHQADALGTYASLPGHEALAELNATWRHSLEAVTSCSSNLPKEVKEEVNRALGRTRGEVLVACGVPRAAEEVARAAKAAASADAKSIDWFTTFQAKHPRSSNPAAVDIVTTMIAPLARDEARKRDAKAEEERRERLAQRREERRAALAHQVVHTRRWLAWVAWPNLLVGTAASAVAVKGRSTLESWEAESGSTADPLIYDALDLAPWLIACLPIAIACLFARRWLRRVEDPAKLVPCQALALVGTLTVPILIPFGLVHAFRSARSIAVDEGRELGSAGWRGAAITGGLLAFFAGLGAIVERQVGLDQRLRDTWPSSVVTWYESNWPDALRLEEVAQHAITVALVGGTITLISFGAAFASYRYNSRSIAIAQQAAAIAGILLGLVMAPLVLTGIGWALVGALYVALAVVAVIVGGAILISICEDM